MNSLTSCSEKPVCWDPACSLCYDPLEQYHAPCPALLSVQSCSALPPACTPVMCWPKVHNTVAKITVPDWEDKDDSGIGLLYRPARYIGWQAGATTLCRSQLYHPFRDYEVGNSCQYPHHLLLNNYVYTQS
jgi:hypothetical protein